MSGCPRCAELETQLKYAKELLALTRSERETLLEEQIARLREQLTPFPTWQTGGSDPGGSF